MTVRPRRTRKRTIPAGLLIGLMLVSGTLIAFSPGVTAVKEYDCEDQRVCDPSEENPESEETGCAFAAEWGSLSARAWGSPRLGGPSTAGVSADADPVGGDNFDRWIITLCDSVSFRPYATAHGEASTTHCWKDGGISHPYPCASVSSTWITNTAGTGSGPSFGAFCGFNTCEGARSGTADHQVTDISLNQPGNMRVDVWGDASARYYEDDEENGCTLCQESLQKTATDSALELFWIGSTPPL